MPNRPSRNCLANLADVWPYAPAQDADAGNDPAACYPSAAQTAVPCSAQPDAHEVELADGRVTTVRDWLVFFGGGVLNAPLAVRDKLVLTTPAGTFPVFVDGPLDGAGRGVVNEVRCSEHA